MRNEHADPLIGTTLAGRYRLEERIGQGGMSTVYRAFDTTLERHVALKVMHREFSRQADFLERFRREARAVAQLSHPHVVTVIDAGQDEGHPYIVFEYVPGENLKQRIRSRGPLPATEAIAYAIEIGRALAAAHACGLVHRDIKPQNVLVDPEGRAKVTDFGIARSLEAATGGLTQTGRVMGTTDYVSPEQAMGKGVGGQSDIYSLGIVLYEMLTGEPPFRGNSQVTVAMKHVRESLPDVQKRRPEISAALAAVVERATAKDKAARYPTISEAVADLEDALTFEVARSGQSTGEVTTVLRSLPASAVEGRMPLRLRHPRRLALIALLGAASIALAIAALPRIRGRGETSGGPRSGGSLTAVSLPGRPARDYDPPPGDHSEHPEKLQTVVDGNPETFWDTETYQAADFGDKQGVGLLIHAGRPVAALALDVRSPRALSGYDVEILGAAALPAARSDAGWTLLASKRKVAPRERYALDTRGRKFRYYLIWITHLGGNGPYRAGISELKLLG